MEIIRLETNEIMTVRIDLPIRIISIRASVVSASHDDLIRFVRREAERTLERWFVYHNSFKFTTISGISINYN